MRTEELAIIALIGFAVIVIPLTALILSIIAIVRARQIKRLTQRVAQLESLLAGQSPVKEGSIQEPPVVADVVTELAPPTQVVAEPMTTPLVSTESISIEQREPEQAVRRVAVRRVADRQVAGPQEPINWETLIGQKAFGWAAVLLFVFAIAFFLRYAYQNNWIGPVGRVTIGALTGLAIAMMGFYYHRQGWLRFSQMLTTAGIVTLYLATYSSFAFYRLLPQQHASVFLAILVIESMVLAVVYRSTLIAIAAVIGGLLTPILMAAEHDQYQSFFIYLIVLNLGVVICLTLRSWAIVGTLAYTGTQWLFWSWYGGNYHPEKFGWALGFEVSLFSLYVAHTVATSVTHRQHSSWEDVVRCIVNASAGFGSYYILTMHDYRIWLGPAALTVATLYAALTRWLLAWRPHDHRLLLTTLAVATGFVAWAIPIQAEARWVPLGWAVMAGALYWFGHRVSSPFMRSLAGVLGLLAVLRLLIFELPLYTRDPFWPIFNRFALPSLGVTVVIIGTLYLTRPFRSRFHSLERIGTAAAGAAAILLIWLILSIDCYGFFVTQSIGTGEGQEWRWRGQLALSILWTAFAASLLGVGFRLQQTGIRWLAFALFGATVLKLFMVDMAHVQQLYRILAFFVLAVVLAMVARVYQRFRQSDL